MALVTTNTNIKIGFDQRTFSSGNSVVVSATTGGLSLPFVSQFTGSITRVIMTATITTAVTNLNVGIMASNATGDLPSDTYLATPDTFSGSVNSTVTNYTINLTNSISVTRGQVYWLTFKPNASFTGNISIYQNNYLLNAYGGYWRTATRSASVWSRSATTGSNAIYGSSTQWYSIDVASVPEDQTPYNAAVNQEYGVAFTLNANHPAIRVKGISFANSLNGNATTGQPGCTFLCNIRNSSGTLLYSFGSQDTDRINAGAGNGNAYFFNQTTSDIWFEPGVKYYLMMAFTGTFTGSPQFTDYDFDTNLASAMGAYIANYAERSSGGVMSEVTTRFMAFHIEVDAIRFDNAATGSGGYVNASPMFTGGFSG